MGSGIGGNFSKIFWLRRVRKVDAKGIPFGRVALEKGQILAGSLLQLNMNVRFVARNKADDVVLHMRDSSLSLS